MTSQPASPPHWPMDDRWLDELDALLPVEIVASFAPAQAAPHVPATSTAPVTPPTSSASEDGDEERIVASRTPDRRREYRQKKRRELLELREASSELQAQLYELLQRRQALAVPGNGSKRLIAGWRGVALRQMQRRLASEALNRELRAQLRTRHEATVSLMETLRAQMVAVEASRAAELARGQPAKPVIQLSEKDVWDLSLLVHEVDEMCAHASAEIQRVRMPQLEADKTYNSRFSRDVISTSGVRTATFTEMMVVPFPFMDTNLAMEKVYPMMISSECVPAIIEVGEDGSTAAVKYAWGPFEVLSISKAIEVSKRTNLAWRSIIRERGQPAGPCITEYGWGSVVPADELATSTRVQLLTKWRDEQLEAFTGDMVVPNTGSLERYTQMLVESSENDAAELVRTVENVIIDEMVTRKRGSIEVCEG